MTVLLNSFEGGTSGTSVSSGNSGGLSGNAFDSVTIGTGATVAYDNTHPAHGFLGCKIATSGTSAAALLTWSTSMGSQTTIWYRVDCYFTANPSVAARIFRASQTAANLCAGVDITTAGKVQVFDANNTQITISTATIPLNQPFRVEGFITGNLTTGQTESKLFKTLDSTTADDVQTSAATFNTRGAPDTFSFGVPTTASVIGPYWIDDVGISSTGYLNPPFVWPVTVTTTGALTRQLARTMLTTVTTTAAVFKNVGKTLAAAAVTTAGTLATLITHQRFPVFYSLPPQLRWATGTPFARWIAGTPFFRWVAGPPI